MPRSPRTILPLLPLALAACATTPPSDPQHPQVLLRTSAGDISLVLDPQHAPISTANFLQYVCERRYDGTVFHRIVPGFVIQGGGYDVDLKDRPRHLPIKLEAGNGLHNLRGTVAMARDVSARRTPPTPSSTSTSPTTSSWIRIRKSPAASMAMPCSAASAPAWTWSTALPRCRPVPWARTSPPRRSSRC